MIVRMAKVEIIGPKEQLMPVLALLRGRGVFQPDPSLMRASALAPGGQTHGLVLSADEIRERLFFEELRSSMRQLVDLLPELPVPSAHLHPLPVMDVLAELVEKHIEEAERLQTQLEEQRADEAALARDLVFWETLEPMLADLPEESDLEFLGVTIHDASHLEGLKQLLQERLYGQCEISVARTAEGALVGLVATSRQMADQLRSIMTDERVPELPLPEELSALSIPERIVALRHRVIDCQAAIETCSRNLDDLARQWLPVYRQALDWLEERLALYRATATAYETRQCFVVEGWMAADEVDGLRRQLTEKFDGQVVLEQLEIMEEELDMVPVVLHNPGYFAPFEVFSRLLPLPKYTSYDPTPFIGLFFPLLFGMILGDIGYGCLLLILAVLLVKYCTGHPLVVNLGKVLGAAALYTMLFGLLFGELFGNLGEQWFGLHPLWVDRIHAIVPMIIFAISVGVAHVLFGLALGIWTDLRRHQGREALVKLLTIVLVLLGILTLVAWIVPKPWLAVRPLLISIAVILPVLVAAGGLLAPLELLKTFGNIISYVRIMAIGLCSVLLAVVANRLGGATGDVLAGLLVAGMLHAFNLLLGVFAPTVHSLRLHYVEFFSKFLDLGGRRFEPLERNGP
jgi:V/A-type H+-transporting ATPase subunit I